MSRTPAVARFPEMGRKENPGPPDGQGAVETLFK